jgi:glycosyltransferase involved in cell wall biosynthesis
LIQADEQMDTPVNLVLAGGASHAEAYGKRLRRHQSDRVRILDWVSGEALDERLTNAMLFVLPSDLENLSLALLHAMGAGVCVLASDIPENRELVDGTAFTFRHGDRDDLERMLRLLISEPGVRKAAADKTRERVWEHYMWGRVAGEIEGNYPALAAGSNVPKPATPATATRDRPRAA